MRAVTVGNHGIERMKFPRMPIEEESPEQMGYARLTYNLTESSLRDRTLASLGFDLSKTLLCYSDHMGHPGLRAEVARRAGGGLTADNVILAAGAAQALFMIAVSQLNPGDHVIVVRPNYATNLVTPRVLRAELSTFDLSFDEGYALDPEKLAKLVRPNTKLISITTPHNPTGVSLTRAALESIIASAQNARVLVDETYRDLSFIEKLPVAATLSDRVVSVCSLSKSHGAPGIRLGWAITQDKALMHDLLCAKEQIGICGSVIDEEIGAHIYINDAPYLRDSAAATRAAFETVKAWMARETRLEWNEPTGGCVAFPRIRAGIDVPKFYKALNDTHGCFVGPGRWFEQDDRYFRLGYGWPTAAELAGGLGAISASLDAAG